MSCPCDQLIRCTWVSKVGSLRVLDKAGLADPSYASSAFLPKRSGMAAAGNTSGL